MSVRCRSKKDAISFIMAFQSGCRLEDLAVPSPSLRRCFINNNTIRSLLRIRFKSTSARYGIRNTRLGSKFFFVRGQRFLEKTNVSVTQKTQVIIFEKIKVKKVVHFHKGNKLYRCNQNKIITFAHNSLSRRYNL